MSAPLYAHLLLLSVQGLMKALSVISEDYGSVFVEFGQPLSLHDFCVSRGVSRIPHTIFPKLVTYTVLCVCVCVCVLC